MQTVFDASTFAREGRSNAWQSALCDTYVNVDAAVTDRADYRGFVRAAQFGAVTITDTLLSSQEIRRRRKHLARVDKDCYYLQFIQRGRINVLQERHELGSNSALGTLFYASEPYHLQCVGEVRAYYVEIPRESLIARLSNKDIPVSANFSTGAGLGRVAADFCLSLATESDAINDADKAQLGNDLLDLVARAVDRSSRGEPVEHALQKARLHAIKSYVDQNLGNPVLSLNSIAKNHGISVRYLHHLFRQEDMSPSDWIWNRRLERCYDLLSAPGAADRSVTDIAYSAGFSSSSHFSTLFKAKFGVRPTDVRRRAFQV
jgi:AraC-like DNA-binding protein